MARSTKNKSITLHDVAREAGVSLMTASRALNKPALVTQATIEKVREAAAAVGYVPNLLAGSLKSSRSKTVAGLVPIISVPQFLPTVRALTETLYDRGYHLILGQSGYTDARQEQLISTLIGRQPDGLVSIGRIRTDRDRKQLQRLGIPVVETWEIGEKPVDMAVGFSHIEVGRAVARYFKSKGWKRIGVAASDDSRAQLRVKGFRDEIGRKISNVALPAPSNLELGRRSLTELLKQDAKLEAVFCSSDNFAHGVMLEAQSRGLNVPKDLAVCGFGGADFTAHTLPALTTVSVDGAEIGRVAAQLILDRCTGKSVPSKTIDLGFEIVERQSTGKPTK